MKKQVILFLMLITAYTINAQFIRTGDNSPGFKLFTERPLLVELTKDSSYNEALKDAFNEYWKFTPFQFIEKSERYKYDLDKKYNIYTAVDYSRVFNKWLKQDVYVDGYGILFSAGDKTSDLSPNLLSFSPNNNGVPKLHKNQKYNLIRLKYTVSSTNNLLEFIKENKISGMTTQSYIRNFEEITKKNAHKIKDKTLLILEDMTKPMKSGGEPYIDEELLKDYPYKYKIVSVDELIEITNKKDANYCFMDMLAIHAKYFLIYDVGTLTLLYANSPGYHFTFEKSDVKDIVNAIN